MPVNYHNGVPVQVPYRSTAPLTQQVPNLSMMPEVGQDERWGFLPFVGGLALGGLLFNGWGGRPCCGGGGYSYPAYQPVYYQQQQQQAQNGYYGPYNPVMPSETTILESNKYYLS